SRNLSDTSGITSPFSSLGGRLSRLLVFSGSAQPLEPIKNVAHMLRAREELLLNWFRAKAEVSAGAVEGLNKKIRVVIRRSYGFRTYEAMEIALYHTLAQVSGLLGRLWALSECRNLLFLSASS